MVFVIHRKYGIDPEFLMSSEKFAQVGWLGTKVPVAKEPVSVIELSITI
jgi:hypothetical protein